MSSAPQRYTSMPLGKYWRRSLLDAPTAQAGEPVRVSTPILVGLINAVLVGAFAGLVFSALGAALLVSVLAAIVTLAVLLIVMVRNTEHAWTDRAEFPS
jgi:hypothetical protein